MQSEESNSVSPITLYNGSQIAQKSGANYDVHRKSKHSDIRYHFVKDAVSNKISGLKYLPYASWSSY